MLNYFTFSDDYKHFCIENMLHLRHKYKWLKNPIVGY